MKQIKPKVLGWLKQFGIRLAICLFVLGGIYIAIFGLKPASHKVPVTDSEKRAYLRSAVAESSLASSDVAAFKERSPLAYNDMSVLRSRLSTTNAKLQDALQRAPTSVSAGQRKNASSILAGQQKVATNLLTGIDVLGQVVQYDPATDLTPVASKADQLAARATAAAKGLTKAANSQTLASSNDSGLAVSSNALLVPDNLKQLLLSNAACFSQVAAEATANKLDQAVKIQQACTANYPALRQAAVATITSSSVNNDYLQSLKTLSAPLLH